LQFDVRQYLIKNGGLMDINAALKQEESKLHRQLTAVRGAITALKGQVKASTASRSKASPTGPRARKTMSAAVRAKISRTAKARWAKIRAENAAGKKAK
jgi:hypothetical protein